jgi:hypothetical protein
LKIKKIEITVLLLIFFLVVIFLQLRFYNLGSNHFDTGVELHDTYKIFKGEIYDIFRGHFKIIKLPLSQVFQLNDIYFISIFFFVLQTLCILSPLFFLCERKIKILYLMNPITWNFLLGDFHYDYFLIPLFFSISSLQKKNQNYALLTYTYGFIKETFFIFPLLTGIYYFFNYRKIKWLFLFAVSLISFVFIYYLIYRDLSFGFEYDRNIIEYKNNLRNQLLFFIMIMINFFLLSQKLSNKLSLIQFFCILFIYILFNIKGQRLGFFSHYYLPFFLILFSNYDILKIKKKYNLRVLISVFLLYIASAFPLGYHFILKDINLSYSHKRIFTDRDNVDLSKYKLLNKIVIVSNNFLIPETIKSKNLLSFDNNAKLKEADIIILSKKLISFEDKVCSDIDNCFFKDDYNSRLNLINKYFYLDQETEKYKVFIKSN